MNDDIEFRQALNIIARRRQRDIEETFVALDLAAAMLNVLREDTLAAQILDIIATLKRNIPKEALNAVDISRRPQTYEFSEHPRQAETMVESSKLHLSRTGDEARAIREANSVVAASASSPQTSKRKSK